jgi:hypothetical protein
VDTTGAPDYTHDDWLLLASSIATAFVYVAMADDGQVSKKEIEALVEAVPRSVLALIPEGRGALSAFLEVPTAAVSVAIEGYKMSPQAMLGMLLQASQVLDRAAEDHRWVFKRGLTDLAMDTAVAGTPIGNAKEEWLTSSHEDAMAMLQAGMAKQRAAQEIIDLLGVRPEVVRPAVNRVLVAVEKELGQV